MEVPQIITDTLWRVALASIPLSAGVWLLCRILPLRASTRHSMWAVVLGVLLAAPLAPVIPARQMLASAAGWLREARAWAVEPAARELSLSSVASAPREAPSLPSAKTQALPQASEPAPPASQTAAPGLAASTAQPPTSRLADASDTAHSSASGDPARHNPRQNPPTSAPAQTLRTPPASVPSDRTRSDMPRSGRPRLDTPRSDVPRPDAHHAGRAGASHKGTSTPSATPVQPILAEPVTPTPTTSRLAPPEMPASSPALPQLSPAPPGAVTSHNPPPAIVAAAPSSAWRPWIDSLRRIGNDVLSLPAMPRSAWLIGAGVIVVLMGLQIALCRVRLCGCFPAPRPVRDFVASAASEMGLRRPPEVLMVASRISPMIWCGWRTRLILPAELWDELDDIGRRAVIHHELAHLRRRDHWLCWIELLACILYWWHPVVWWVRRRLREEADLCCDAWVTALMPRQRRAYAQALLRTQRFLGGKHVAPPATGLGVISGGAKRFARRLTMVMTERAKPHRSLTGIALAALVAAAGLASASLACPPEDEKEKQKAAEVRAAALAKQKTEQAARNAARVAEAQTRAAEAQARTAEVQARAKARTEEVQARAAELRAAQEARAAAAPKPAKAPKAAAAPKPPKAPRRAAVVTPEGVQEQDASTFEEHMRNRASAGSAPSAPAADRGLERRLDSLERRLDQMEQRLNRVLERLERRGEAATVSPALAAAFTQPGGATVARIYTLPKNVSKQICELMAHDDVPVLVTPGDGQIIVHGNEGQQLAFGNFLGLITGGDATGTRLLPLPNGTAAASALKSDLIVSGMKDIDALREYYLLAGAQDDRKAAADLLRARADTATRQAGKLSAQLEQSIRAAKSLGGAERDAAAADIESLETEIETLQESAEELRDQARELADEINDAIKEATEQLESLLKAGEDPVHHSGAYFPSAPATAPVTATAPGGCCDPITAPSIAAVAPSMPMPATPPFAAMKPARPAPAAAPIVPAAPAAQFPAAAPAPAPVSTPAPTASIP